MLHKDLHPAQAHLIRLLAENAEAPLTIRELQGMIGAKSTSVVTHHLGQLEKKGYLKRNPYNSKDYQIVKGGPENPVAHLNLYGLATCGPSGSVLDGDPIDRIPISPRLLSFPAAEAFLVRAKGASMEPKIHNNDLIIARRVSEPESGKVYVCVNEGNALIKRVMIDNNAIILQSFNPDFPTFIASEDDFKIEGEVKAVLSGEI